MIKGKTVLLGVTGSIAAYKIAYLASALVKQGAKEGTLIAIGVAMLITCGILLFGRYLMEIFTQTAELVALSVYMMRILAVGYIAMAVAEITYHLLRTPLP